jgi:hypothetical protein
MPRSNDPVQGTFSGVLTGFASGLTGVPGQEQVGDLSDMVSEGVLAQPQAEILPAPAARAESDSPLTGLLGGLLGGDLLGGDLLGGGLGGLPINGLPAAGGRELPQQPAFGPTLSPLSAIELSKFGGFGGQRSATESPLEYAPVFGDLTDVTTIIPAVPASGDLTDVTTVLPVIPAAPVSANLPVMQGMSPRTGESSLDSTRAALANLFATHPIA